MADLELGPLRIGIVGAGRLGCVLARALATAELQLVAASSHRQEGRERAARLLQVPVHEDPLQVAADADVLLLCVPDDAVGAVVQRLASHEPAEGDAPLRIVSTSAVAGLGALAPLAEAGHDVLVLHPVRTVADAAEPPEILRGAGAAVIAASPAAATLGQALAHALGMVPFPLEEDRRLLHAAACQAASTCVTVALGIAEDLATEAGLHESVSRIAYGNLAADATARVSALGATGALGGPIMRTDVEAVRALVATVDEAVPSHADTLRALLLAAVRRGFEGGRIEMPAAGALGEAIGGRPPDARSGSEAGA